MDIGNEAALPGGEGQDLADRVRAAEAAFARTMADRDLEGFLSFVAEEAVFFGSRGVLRGRSAVREGWRPYFEGPEAPFSWEPEIVEVLPSGDLAHSSGPVRDPQGRRVATFDTVWRLQADGSWRVVFDKGNPAGGDRQGWARDPESSPGAGRPGAPARRPR